MGAHGAVLLVPTVWLKRACDLAAQHPRNHNSCDYGENPTRGIFVYLDHLLSTRNLSHDEHATTALSLPS
jgi:hypothetical protein